MAGPGRAVDAPPMTVLELTREQPVAAPEYREIRYSVDPAAVADAIAERLLAGRTIGLTSSVLEATPRR